jgi:hypothetical protein
MMIGMLRTPGILVAVVPLWLGCGGARGPDPEPPDPDPVPLVAEPAPPPAAPTPIAVDPNRPPTPIAVDAPQPPPVDVVPPPPPTPPGRPPVLPPALAKVKPWVFRRLTTGLAPEASVLETHRLYRAGTQAALVHEERTSTAPGERRDLSPWSPVVWVNDYVGTITPIRNSAGRRLLLTLRTVDDRGPAYSYELSWTCTVGRTPLAAATATMVPKIPPDRRAEGAECDGDPGQWTPARTRAVSTLTCEPIGQPEDGYPMVFAAGAGVELLRVNDDCMMQGEGLRQASPDGVVAPVRP